MQYGPSRHAADTTFLDYVHAQPAASMLGRPGAASGDAVFLERATTRVLAVVKQFDGSVYHLNRRNLDDGIINHEPWTIDITKPDGHDGWQNAALPTCCVCLEADADCVLHCRCTAPSVCLLCTGLIDQCPFCREPLHNVTCRRAQPLYSIEPHNPTDPWSYVYIKALDGRLRMVESRDGWSMRTLKGLCAYRLDDPHVVFQRMVFGGRVLGDEGTVSSYGLVREATIHTTFQLRGD
ncbi:Ubiquitin domain containing protein [Pandoravirus macleodensis]|uniref:Ubiquitin domain containing protein n=1 Tax=Pandoravirus macleodensis TaxID=2107707 RepID=A0A2U7UGD4_9VIRU|nr:Ubiquitin domain containing protein [Pandoravirus macleodensis]AVK77420.1 Ubiquitin domain containing protein [Pandoravirus macleodensis]